MGEMADYYSDLAFDEDDDDTEIGAAVPPYNSNPRYRRACLSCHAEVYIQRNTLNTRWWILELTGEFHHCHGARKFETPDPQL